MSKLNLEGKRIFVTGGSRGIGAGIVKELAHRGARVAFSYSSNKEAAEAIVAELPGSGHFIVSMDISDPKSVSESFKTVIKELGGIDGLVNNAGITKDQILLRMKTEDFDAVLNTNLRGSFLCTKEALRPMIKAKGGSIVFITSVVGQMGQGGQANYAASKAGIEAFSKSVAREVASRNIRSNCIAPGFIKSDMTDALKDDQKEEICKNIPLGAIGDPKDIACSVCFLISEDSKYITGTTLSVNGGLYI
jgi:3-oxoacyl-[acyl-carrier protein] reductase